MMPPGIVRTPMGVYVLKDDTHLSRYIEREQRLDIQMNLSLVALVARYVPEGGVVINAGACLGDHAVSYSQLVGPHGTVYAFEPHPVSGVALALNVARLTNVVVFLQGLSDDMTTERFHLDHNIGASCVAPTGTVDIRTVTLDAFLLHTLSRCDFLHLDAEGMEPRILRGARALVARFHPPMLVEVCDAHLRRAGSSEAELRAILGEYGYRILPVPGDDDPAQRDVLCLWGDA